MGSVTENENNLLQKNEIRVLVTGFGVGYFDLDPALSLSHGPSHSAYCYIIFRLFIVSKFSNADLGFIYSPFVCNIQ